MATAFEKFLSKIGNIPGVKIDRTGYLTKIFKSKCANEESLEKILKEGPGQAGIPKEQIDKIADNEIFATSASATSVSFLTGLPGGIAMLATIPTDIAQLYVHIFTVIQKLMYLYGWEDDIFDEDGNMDSETQSIVILYLGLMFGVSAVSKPLSMIAAKASVKYITKAVIKSMGTKIMRNAVIKVIKVLGIRATVKGSVKYFTKAVPVLGGVFSGAITLATILPMSKKLKSYLSTRKINKLDLTVELDESDEIFEDEFSEVFDDVTEDDDCNFEQ